MKTKRQVLVFAILIVLALVVVSLSWVAIYRGEIADQGHDVVKIGVVGHFSGEYASYGVPMKQAVELYVEEVNARGGIDGKKVELMIEDDATDKTLAASAIQKLINIDNINYIISAQGSGATAAVAPIAESNQRILMITLGSAPGLAGTEDYIFRSVPSDAHQGKAIVDLMKERINSKKVAGLYVNDAYGIGIKDVIESGTDYSVVGDELFESGSADFRTQLAKIKAKNPDTVVIVARKNEFPSILKQVKELGLEATIVTSTEFKDDAILAEVGVLANGVYVPLPRDPIDHVGFKEKYKARFNEEPSAYSMYAYDGAVALLDAIDAAGDDVEKVRTELYNVKFNGASGTVGFDSDGDRTGTEYSIYVVRGGEFVLI